MRNLYMYYKRLKQFIDKRVKVDKNQANSANVATKESTLAPAEEKKDEPVM